MNRAVYVQFDDVSHGNSPSQLQTKPG